MIPFIFICGCDNKDETGSIYISSHVDITVIDEKGNDLLDPDNTYAKSIKTDDIKMYYMIDGKETYFYRPLLNASKGYLQLEPEGDIKTYRIRFFLNIESKETNTETIIEWDKEHRDTIRSEVDRNGGVTTITKMWLNNKAIWENNTNSKSRSFTITR